METSKQRVKYVKYLVSLQLTLNIFTYCSAVSIVDFEQVNADLVNVSHDCNMIIKTKILLHCFKFKYYRKKKCALKVNE